MISRQSRSGTALPVSPPPPKVPMGSHFYELMGYLQNFSYDVIYARLRRLPLGFGYHSKKAWLNLPPVTDLPTFYQCSPPASHILPASLQDIVSGQGLLGPSENVLVDRNVSRTSHVYFLRLLFFDDVILCLTLRSPPCLLKCRIISLNSLVNRAVRKLVDLFCIFGPAFCVICLYVYVVNSGSKSRHWP